jgi:hypothetical protein
MTMQELTAGGGTEHIAFRSLEEWESTWALEATTIPRSAERPVKAAAGEGGEGRMRPPPQREPSEAEETATASPPPTKKRRKVPVHTAEKEVAEEAIQSVPPKAAGGPVTGSHVSTAAAAASTGTTAETLTAGPQ